jgi:hypothetical protein
MFRISSLAIGLLTVITLAPQSQSIAASVDNLSIQTSIGNLSTQQSEVKISETEQGKRLAQRRRIFQEQPDATGDPEDSTGDPTDDPRQQPPKQEGDETTSPHRKKRCGCHRRHRRHHRHHDRHDDYRDRWERHDRRY